MESPRTARVRAVFEQAVQRPREAQTAYVRDACPDDPSVCSEVLDLLQYCSSIAQHAPASSGTDAPWPAVSAADARPFPGTDRYAIRRRLGSGGFGVVYEAEDRLRQQIVALKVLTNVTAHSLYRFKREFRSLADISHTNLVQLFEMSSHGTEWFFTMELVDGVTFVDYVTSGSRLRAGTAAAGVAAENIPRTRDALAQLAGALHFLHECGHVHRDVKPSNVLVTRDGRVVLLDFGLILDLQGEAALQSLIIAGTPAYMSPEQAAGLPITPATDWYSVGAMLYQVLTGRLPFAGNYLQVLSRKQAEDPPPPRAVATSVPDDLDGLCMRLLARDPLARPTASEILSTLAPTDTVTPPLRRDPRMQPFVGREQQLHALDAAVRRVRLGACEVRRVRGTSGIGKSALLRAFVSRVQREHPDAVVLTGRCYERESVPYKALDSIVDALAQYLRRLESHEADAVLPRGFWALAQLFPVLRDVPRTVGGRPASMPADAQELRRRGFSALRELLGRLGDKQLLVLAIDDVHWGDVDSAAALLEVVRGPDAPPLLLVIAYRSDEIDNPFLDTFLRDAEVREGAREISVEPLSAAEARALAGRLLAARAVVGLNPKDVVEEAGGIPFFISELVRFAETVGTPPPVVSRPRGRDSSAREAHLAQMIQIRLSRLPQSAQRVLHVLATNGRPLGEAVLRSAAGSYSSAELALLRSERLVRGRDRGTASELEIYHDRIRQLILATLSADESARLHRQLVDALEAQPTADPELIAEHCFGCGDSDKALTYTAMAARQAEDALAFERAARLYRAALSIDVSGAARGQLLQRLGDALVNVGRGAEASEAYLSAADVLPDQALSLKQQAAQQLLFSGRTDAGLSVTREVLRMIGMRLPSTYASTLLALVIGRMKVRLRGLRFTERPAAEIPPSTLMKIDACWTVSGGLSLTDTLRGAVFQTRHLLLALRAGELARIHRAVCMEMGFVATFGTRAHARTERLRTMADTLRTRVGTPYADGIFLMLSGVADYLCGRWQAVTQSVAAAEDVFTNGCTGVHWELDNCRFYGTWATYMLGHLHTIGQRLAVLTRDAEERGDAIASAYYNVLIGPLYHCAVDDPDAAAASLDDARARWHQADVHVLRIFRVVSTVNVALYGGHTAKAWREIDGAWDFVRRSPLFRVQMLRITMLELRARAALSASREMTSDGRSLAREAARCARAIARERAPWSEGFVHLIRSGLAARSGNWANVIELLDSAERAFAAADMRLWQAGAAHRRGQLIAGTDGGQLVELAAAEILDLGVTNPSAMSRALTPGC